VKVEDEFSNGCQQSLLPEKDQPMQALVFDRSHEALNSEVLKGVLLSAVDPACKDQEQQMPWLKLGLHVPPDAWFRSEAPGIVDTPSSVALGVTAVQGKASLYKRLRSG
jgi:hypothetical protein